MESFFIFVFGVLVIIILFNLFLWLNLGEKIYIYYVGYTFFALLYLINISGLLAYLDLQYYMYKLHFTVGFAIVFLNLFSIEYFNTKKHLKYATYLLKFLAFCVLIFGVISMFVYAPFNKMITYTVSLSIISLMVSALIIYAKGHYYLKYYIFAIVLYFVSIIIFTLLLSGILEYSFFARYAFLFALAIEIVIFSLMLADRYNDIKNKQIQTQRQLISLQNNQNKILEEEVTKQTRNLQDANGKLSSLVQERELLVKEVFHRVKNNFHMISAFLWFESKKEVNPNRFSELINRIKSMSLIHEYVCNSKNLLHINAEEYLVELINTIMRTYHNTHVAVNTKVEAMHIDF
ncbi:MAG: 7TM diverse intracellular signaling domain-containing protein, partial [Sulfurimonas sp.]|nr:7TM diverse intracellular signaling domain-containing protein [Sulfurimonas sp.]